jgi:hypothetical protein
VMIWFFSLVSAQIFEKTRKAFEEDVLHLEGIGDIYANLTLYSDENYENQITEGGYFPDDMKRFYFDVRTESGKENIKVKDCKARIWPDPDDDDSKPDAPWKVHFIRQHCVDPRFEVRFEEPSKDHQLRFSLNRFRFPHPTHDHIRMACTVTLCLPGDIDCGVCTTGFVKPEKTSHSNWEIRDTTRNLIGMNFKIKLY